MSAFRASLRTAPLARRAPLPASLLSRRAYATPSRPRTAGAPFAGQNKMPGPPESSARAATGKKRIGVSLAIAVTLAFLYFRNPYIEQEGKTPNSSPLDYQHVLATQKGAQAPSTEDKKGK